MAKKAKYRRNMLTKRGFYLEMAAQRVRTLVLSEVICIIRAMAPRSLLYAVGSAVPVLFEPWNNDLEAKAKKANEPKRHTKKRMKTGRVRNNLWFEAFWRRFMPSMYFARLNNKKPRKST